MPAMYAVCSSLHAVLQTPCVDAGTIRIPRPASSMVMWLQLSNSNTLLIFRCVERQCCGLGDMQVRTRRLPEGLQPPYLSPDVMVGAVVTSGADGSLQVSPASPALPAKPLTLAEKIDKFRDTGVDVAGQGVFAMAALDSAGVLPRAQGEKPAAYIQRLHQAAQAGCLEALLALADR